MITFCLSALVVQWIECELPELKIKVRFLARVPYHSLLRGLRNIVKAVFCVFNSLFFYVKIAI